MSPAGDQPKNMAASVHQRLLNEARRSGRPFNELLQYYAMERFLYRLSRSTHSSSFLLKGALMLRVWGTPTARPTMDIDLLGRLANQIEHIVEVIQSICRQEVEEDGMTFDAGSVEAHRIAEDAEYEGVRATFSAHLGNARLPMQIDIGFGDVVVPGPMPLVYPTLLDLPAPNLNGYPRETAIAEKFQAMARLGLINSRMKDYFDIYTLSRQFDFDGPPLAEAIRRTFAHRDTDILDSPVALSEQFASDSNKGKQWVAFARKLRTDSVPQDLRVIVTQISAFLTPITSALVHGASIPKTWRAPGPWA